MFTSFICKGLLFWFLLCLQRAADLVFHHKIAKKVIVLVFAIHLQRTVVLVFAIHLQRTAVLVFCHSPSKDCSPCLLPFICKGLQSLPFAIHLQRTAALSFAIHLQRTAALSFAIHLQWTAVLIFAIHLQRTAVLVFCHSPSKDCSPCLLPFICKGLQSLPFAIHLQRTAALSFAIHLQRTAALSFAIHLQWTAVLIFAIHLQMTAVLVFCHSSAKNCGPCLLPFICKGLRSLSFAIHLLVYLLFCLDGVSSLFLPFVPIFPFHWIRRNTALVTANSFQRKMLSLFSTFLYAKD